jgi:hypothetical protein
MTLVHSKNAFHRPSRGRQACSHRVDRLALTAAVMVWVLTGVPGAHSQQAKPNEYQVKAAYLYNFGRFIQWPGGATTAKGEPFTICVLGRDPFGAMLNAVLADETINGRSVVAKRIPAPEDAVDCRILFISSSEVSQLKHILAALDSAKTLTVSDMPQFSRRGGMVQFILEGNYVRFEVNLTPAEHAGLTLSSDLLKLATSVRHDNPQGD